MRISDWSSDVCSSDLDQGHVSTPKKKRAAATDRPFVSCHSGPDQILPVSSGTALKRSATRPRSATWKIGASSSLLIATIVFESFKIGRASCRERVCQYV